MSKTEPLEQEQTSSAVPSCSDSSLPSSDKPEPRTSTPIQREGHEQATVVSNGSVAFAQPTLTNHSQSNGHVANGKGYMSAPVSDYCDKPEPIAWTVVRWTLIAFLFFVLFIAVCIAAFEATEGTADHRWYKSFPQVDRFHSSFYAPWRHSVLYSYHRFFN
ncbi:hypothetical protein AAVH_41770 [Aphelenchoides avenae]|nr:hypothetical protein AAVH_41770 [Aphelenchus avenae]